MGRDPCLVSRARQLSSGEYRAPPPRRRNSCDVGLHPADSCEMGRPYFVIRYREGSIPSGLAKPDVQKRNGSVRLYVAALSFALRKGLSWRPAASRLAGPGDCGADFLVLHGNDGPCIFLCDPNGEVAWIERHDPRTNCNAGAFLRHRRCRVEGEIETRRARSGPRVAIPRRGGVSPYLANSVREIIRIVNHGYMPADAVGVR